MTTMNDFFAVKELEYLNQHLSAVVGLNPQHGIYEGHFPNQPVVPGVCSIYMIKQLLQQYLGTSIRFTKIGSTKFLKMLDPRQDTELSFNIEMGQLVDSTIKLQVIGTANSEVFIKLKGQIAVD